MASKDILLPVVDGQDHGLDSNLILAFVPITVALIGVGLVLFGGVSARGPETATAAVSTIDPMTTGSVMSPEERRRALELLDR